MERIGDVIRKYRKANNLTQEELGSKLFVTKQTVSKWENGRTMPDIDTTKKLIEILNIDPNEILGGTVQEAKRSKKLLMVFGIISGVVVLLLSILLAIQQHKKAKIESGYLDIVNSPNIRAIDVSMVRLLANPEEYDGKLVRVIGVGNLEFEGNFIALSKEDYTHCTDNTIWLEWGERAILYDEATAYNGEYVIVEGIYDKDDLGHFSLYCGAIKDISRYELWDLERD